eukprot:m.151019 g.151019  ORF g.151019 m.151019 type:complete len:329 (+) comp15088_c12_seq19:633-1619(+)
MCGCSTSRHHQQTALVPSQTRNSTLSSRRRCDWSTRCNPRRCHSPTSPGWCWMRLIACLRTALSIRSMRSSAHAPVPRVALPFSVQPCRHEWKSLPTLCCTTPFVSQSVTVTRVRALLISSLSLLAPRPASSSPCVSLSKRVSSLPFLSLSNLAPALKSCFRSLCTKASTLTSSTPIDPSCSVTLSSITFVRAAFGFSSVLTSWPAVSTSRVSMLSSIMISPPPPSSTSIALAARVVRGAPARQSLSSLRRTDQLCAALSMSCATQASKFQSGCSKFTASESRRDSSLARVLPRQSRQRKKRRSARNGPRKRQQRNRLVSFLFFVLVC